MERLGINKSELKRVVQNYNGLTNKEKLAVNEKIDKAWLNAVGRFYDVCIADKELTECEEMCRKYDKITGFNLEEEFEVYSHTVNEFDPEAAEDIYVFDPRLLDRAKYTAEHIDEIRAKLKTEINRLKTARIVINRNGKIKKLEDLLEQKERIADHYKNCMKKQALKKEYLEKRDTLYTPYKNKRNQLLKKHAMEVAAEVLNETPALACVRHSSSVFTKRTPGYDNSALNEVVNTIRDEVNLSIQSDLNFYK